MAWGGANTLCGCWKSACAEPAIKYLTLSYPSTKYLIADLVEKYLAEALKDWPLYQALTGPAGQELGTEEQSQPNRLAPVPSTEIGVIEGEVSSDLWFADLFAGCNDGKFSVESARLAEMRDFRCVPCGHTFLMNPPLVMREVISFLNAGRFIPVDPQQADISEPA